MNTVIVQPNLKAIDLEDMMAPYTIHKSINNIKAPIIIGDCRIVTLLLFTTEDDMYYKYFDK